MSDSDSLNQSIVLIESKDPDIKKRNPFGTGFVIYSDSNKSYVVTCLHVIRDVGGFNNISVENCPATVVASGAIPGLDLAQSIKQRAIDLAVLEVKGLQKKPALSIHSLNSKRTKCSQDN